MNRPGYQWDQVLQILRGISTLSNVFVDTILPVCAQLRLTVRFDGLQLFLQISMTGAALRISLLLTWQLWQKIALVPIVLKKLGSVALCAWVLHALQIYNIFFVLSSTMLDSFGFFQRHGGKSVDAWLVKINIVISCLIGTTKLI